VPGPLIFGVGVGVVEQGRRGGGAIALPFPVARQADHVRSDSSISGHSSIYFRLLGKFETRDGGRAVSVGGPTEQAVLIALLQRPGQTRTTGQVIVASWGCPGAVLDETLYHYVSKLRKALRKLGIRIDSCRPGYRLVLPETAVVDSIRFEELVMSAEAVRRTEPRLAVTRLRAALDLWRGEAALPGLTSPGARHIAARLDGLRLTAAERLAELELEEGHTDEVLASCAALAMVHPNRTRLTVAVMRALRIADRSSEAVELCDRAEQFARRHGNPLPQAIQRLKDELLGGSHAEYPVVRANATLHQMPADASHFVGRSAELAQLHALWPGRETAPAALVVFAVSGMAGVGKTALAVRAAHQLANRFADGNLFLDLHGFTCSATPTPPAEALDILLHGLGVADRHIPESLEARSALYRSELAHRRVLIVLDNVHDAAQVRPLLPGTTNCLVIVTSRRRLTGLDSAVHLNLGTLDPVTAATLFCAVAGDRLQQFGCGQQTVEAIVRFCGELPLAIRIAAARLRTSRVLSPANLLRLLRRDREGHGLAVLDDGERSLAAAFLGSYEHLDPQQRRTFRLLGRHPGSVLGVPAVSALLRVNVNETRLLLDALDHVSLISQPRLDHYHMHDLLRAYAASLPEPTDLAPRGSDPTHFVCQDRSVS
jgi:DNA-binding SARP family transcriptional activator